MRAYIIRYFPLTPGMEDDRKGDAYMNALQPLLATVRARPGRLSALSVP
jgi:hypothetical protein